MLKVFIMDKYQNKISFHVRKRRQQYRLTQQELAAKANVGLRFVRDLEHGKDTLRLER
jgi:y4mF family transcriptional regulator